MGPGLIQALPSLTHQQRSLLPALWMPADLMDLPAILAAPLETCQPALGNASDQLSVHQLQPSLEKPANVKRVNSKRAPWNMLYRLALSMISCGLTRGLRGRLGSSAGSLASKLAIERGISPPEFTSPLAADISDTYCGRGRTYTEDMWESGELNASLGLWYCNR